MKVNFPSSSNLYRKSQTVRAESSKGSSASAKTDVADFSRGSGAIPDKALIGAKASIQSDVYAPSSAARIAELKQSVKDGSYHVPTADLVKALLSE